jgi:hypothetical protein
VPFGCWLPFFKIHTKNRSFDHSISDTAEQNNNEHIPSVCREPAVGMISSTTGALRPINFRGFCIQEGIRSSSFHRHMSVHLLIILPRV